MGFGSRSSGLRALLLLAAAALFCGPAAATTFKMKEAKCPGCSSSFRAEELWSTNTFGGIDADGCEQANGLTPFPYLVRACPKCLCARVPVDWEKAPKGDAAKAFLERAAKEPRFAPDSTSGAVPVAVRYELAAGLLEAEGAGAGKRAAVWIRAAWTLRGEVREARIHSEHDNDPTVPEAWWDVTGAAWDCEKALAPGTPGTFGSTGREVTAAREALRLAEARGPATQETLLHRLHAAVVLRVHGELAPAAAALELLARSGGGGSAPEAEKTTRAWVASESTRLLAGIAREREYLGRCRDALLERFKAGGKPPPLEDAWLLSECCRRLGDDGTAAKWVGVAVAGGKAPDSVLVLLRDAAEFAGGGTPAWKAVVDKAWAERLDLLVTRLADLEKGEEAASNLAKLADPATLPALANALGNEDSAANAAIALAGYEEPGDDVLKALEALAGNADGDPEVRWRAVEALAAYAHPRTAPLLRAVVEEGAGSLLEPAVRGLGLAGEAADAAAILAAAADEPKAALTALGMLAGREFPNLDEAKRWWETRGTLGPEARLRECLLAADPKLPDADGPARRAALAELLMNTSLGVRWNAYRALRAALGRGPGRREVLYVGRFRSPETPDRPLDLERVLGDGVTQSYKGSMGFDMDGMGEVMQPLRDRDGKGVWAKARARWRRLLDGN